MCRELITLPLRIAACATRLGVRVTEQAAGMALGVTKRLIEAVGPGESPDAAAGGGGASGSVRVGVVIASSPSISEMTVDRSSVQDVPDAAWRAEPRTPPTSAQVPAAKVDSTARMSPSPTAPSAPEVVAFAPPHVSEELQFVEAFAEPGAEEGAGAEVHVREPWNGYARMNANAVTARLTGASREEIAAVILYERVHRHRQTVLAAAERQLRRSPAGGPKQQVAAVDGPRKSGSAT
jgi:hypothetical protein